MIRITTARRRSAGRLAIDARRVDKQVRFPQNVVGIMPISLNASTGWSGFRCGDTDLSSLSGAIV